MSREDYEENIDYLIAQIKDCGNPDEIFMPGERGYLHEAAHPETVELSASIIKDVNNLAESAGIASRL